MDLVYDDEPLEELLYGHVTHGPSAANLYSPFKRLEQALSGTDGTAIEQAFREASCCCESNPTLIPEIVTLLSKLARRCLPQWPKPLNAALSTAGLQLLEFLWKRSRDAEHRSSILSVGSVLWEWYEYARRPALASEVLEEMIGLCQDQDANETLQGLCNNLAYQRFLLQDWSRSQQAYQSACEIAERAGRRADLLNSRVGWWAARYEEQPNEVAAELVAKLRPVLSEIRDLNRLLTARKALRYLALAEARLGQGQSALAFVDQAIEIDRQFQSMFLEEDLALRAAIRGIHTETLLDPVPPDIASID
ncbi:MAG: hypothetical protein AABP62_14305 [Planctomycetota bacterium]